MTKLVRTIRELRSAVSDWHREGHIVALVPTMGALHEGHLTLVREGFKHAQKVVVTIFVNPKQFAPNEDLDKYRRTEEQDMKLLESEGASLVFAPLPAEIFRSSAATTVHVEGPAKAGLEDHFRPQFFDGVATVVAKLFIQSQADVAMFGEKDYQQLMVVFQMAADLDMPIRVIAVPTVREADGLAMSSRNRYLTAEQRAQAIAISTAMNQVASSIPSGVTPETAALSAIEYLTKKGFKVDYVAVRNAQTLAMPSQSGEPLRVLVAAWLGTTRLIDNMAAGQ